MKDGHIVALGRVCIDEYYQLDAWPKMGEKKFVLPLNRQVGGMIRQRIGGIRSSCLLA